MATFTVSIDGMSPLMYEVCWGDKVSKVMQLLEDETGLVRGCYSLLSGGDAVDECTLIQDVVDMEVVAVPSKAAWAKKILEEMRVEVSTKGMEDACERVDLEVVGLLLEAAVEVLPRMVLDAAKEGHHLLVEMLMSHLPSTTCDEEGDTPLIIAAENGHLPVVRALLESAHVCPNTANDLGTTPLMAAVINHHSDVAAYLLKNPYVYVDATDCDGDTALHLAAMGQHSCLATELIAHGADPIARNRKAATPKDIAVGTGSSHIIEVFA
eukprot:TRINITY_DN3531_c1_g1_i1.p1 TRINITY_DN3531_c1_g1~~TRINITY_DN3531_c1_g1_i1.p1  ORF type:complete len:294 (+),score=64.25 TRINITY_DN3531_c1_g1_i1:80-883(+)